MREINFRAWVRRLDRMCNVTGIDFERNEINILSPGWHMSEWLRRDQVELMQYTGLKDNNGREVYEGDVVKNEYGKVMDIQYDPRSTAFGVGDYYFGTIGSGKILEVIGNIFENPELLEAN